MTIRSSISLSRFSAPRYWPTWAGIATLYVLAWMPWSLRMLAGKGIGLLMFAVGRDRRYITRTNIRLCFPELSPRAQEALVRKSFVANGIGLIETASSWFRSNAYFSHLVTFRGLEALNAARAQGRGVLIVGAHYSTLDLGGSLLALACPFGVTYRPHRNPLFNAFMVNGRLKKCSVAFDRHDIRGAFRHLKRGEILWYAPDQDYGPEHAVFAPFFGRPAATITATSRFASINHSPVILLRHHRLEGRKGYEMEFLPVPADFPCGEDVRDATLINRMLENAIRQYPEQYLWMHKRFKTQPGGKPESPYINTATASSRLSAEQYENLIEGARSLSPADNGLQEYHLSNGFMLKCFPGLPGRLLPSRHPAWRLDRKAKAVRMAGLHSLTVVKIFPVAQLDITALSCYILPGQSLATLKQEEAGQTGDFPWQEIGIFLAQLHQAGFRMERVRADQLFFDGRHIWIGNPQELSQVPMSLSAADRFDNLRQFMDNPLIAAGGRHEHFSILYSAYRQQTDAACLAELDAINRHRPLF